MCSLWHSYNSFHRVNHTRKCLSTLWYRVYANGNRTLPFCCAAKQLLPTAWMITTIGCRLWIGWIYVQALQHSFDSSLQHAADAFQDRFILFFFRSCFNGVHRPILSWSLLSAMVESFCWQLLLDVCVCVCACVGILAIGRLAVKMILFEILSGCRS